MKRSAKGRVIPDVCVVTGTGTEVGKTWVTSALIGALQADGVPVIARKPVQSFDVDGGPTDADVLAGALGIEAHEVCPLHRWYEVPMAPPMAAEALGLPPLSLDELVAELSLPEVGLVFVEGVGGPRSPLTDDADTVDLAEALDARMVLLVADAGLGTINAVLLAVAALEKWDTIVFLNRFEPGNDLHRRNLEWLREAESLSPITSVKELSHQVQRRNPQRKAM
ncbi:MAG: AAA family ATPase [Actinobacteria bacterium]|nr:AAA family ATPase [Actinomycetota bacterium]